MDRHVQDLSASPEIERRLADIVALAGGSLDPGRRAEVSKQVAGSAELTAALEEQPGAIALLAGAER
jgi:hypothetical protein